MYDTVSALYYTGIELPRRTRELQEVIRADELPPNT